MEESRGQGDGDEEFLELKNGIAKDISKINQCARAKYNLRIEKRNEERCKIAREIVIFHIKPSPLMRDGKNVERH